MTIKSKYVLSLGLGTIAVLATIWIGTRLTHHPSIATKQDLTTEKSLSQFIASHKGDSNKKVQDQVTEAGLRLGYLEVTNGNKSRPSPESYQTARQTFLETAKDYKGTGLSSADFGSLDDQALYQAAVCLSAEGKNQQALTAFRDFMKTRPNSPLCKACFDRLRRMEGGFKDGAYVSPDDQRLYQHDLNSQSAHVRFETSICGPKCVAKLLTFLGKTPPPIEQIAKGCYRTDNGTSIASLRHYLNTLGVNTFALQLNAKDFQNIKAPAILSLADHFVLIEQASGGAMKIYDPFADTIYSRPMPSPTDLDFTADVITVSPLPLN